MTSVTNPPRRTPPAATTYSNSPERHAPKGSSAFFPHADKSGVTPAGGYGATGDFPPPKARPATYPFHDAWTVKQDTWWRA